MLDSEEPVDPYKFESLACPRERSDFYESKQWKRRARAVRAVDHFQCQRCGESNRELHVHHFQPIYSVYSKKFARNFEMIRLRTWCKACHQNYHNNSIRNPQGFSIATTEEKADEKERDRERRRAHDQALECLYCKKFVWSKE